jgi:riboflavin synthase
MFTGIIGGLGTVQAVDGGEEGSRLRIRAKLAAELEPGDSIAVNGACLTATSAADGSFEAEVMNQTLSLTTLGALEPHANVNLELPLRPTDRLGGHLVQGHVDGTGTVSSLEDDGFAKRLRVRLGEELAPYVAERGSIAIEGVSLTLAAVGADWIEVSLIPETFERTTLGALTPGDRVNLECDVLARYVQRQLAAGSGVSPLTTEKER